MIRTSFSDQGIKVDIPEDCEICGLHTGIHYDVHMVLIHPETRPKPQITAKPKKKKKTKKSHP